MAPALVGGGATGASVGAGSLDGGSAAAAAAAAAGSMASLSNSSGVFSAGGGDGRSAVGDERCALVRVGLEVAAIKL